MDPSNIRSFECPICEEIYQKPIYQCSTGHSFCSSCKSKLLHCPICTTQFQETRNYALEAIMETIQAKCKNESCPETIALSLYSQHVNECKYQDIKCKFSGCTWSGLNNAANEHILMKHKSLVVEKCTVIISHQITRCFLKHLNHMVLVTRHKSDDHYTWVAEATDLMPVKKLILVIKITKANDDSYIISQPINEYMESGYKFENNVIWVLANKLKGCKFQMTIEDTK